MVSATITAPRQSADVTLTAGLLHCRPGDLPARGRSTAAHYGAADECFRDFLFAALHTGLRTFCELAKVTADDVEESPRGMMWRVYSSKTKKTR